MVSYGSFTYSDLEVGALTTYLRDCARRGQITHYDDSYNVAQKFGSYHGPHDQRLWWLLGYISEEEIKAGRCALSAIVVIKRSEERRVGKECRYRRWPYHEKKNIRYIRVGTGK